MTAVMSERGGDFIVAPLLVPWDMTDELVMAQVYSATVAMGSCMHLHCVVVRNKMEGPLLR